MIYIVTTNNGIRAWLLNLAMGVAEILDGLIRVLTLSLIGTSFAYNIQMYQLRFQKHEDNND